MCVGIGGDRGQVAFVSWCAGVRTNPVEHALHTILAGVEMVGRECQKVRIRIVRAAGCDRCSHVVAGEEIRHCRMVDRGDLEHSVQIRVEIMHCHDLVVVIGHGDVLQPASSGIQADSSESCFSIPRSMSVLTRNAGLPLCMRSVSAVSWL